MTVESEKPIRSKHIVSTEVEGSEVPGSGHIRDTVPYLKEISFHSDDLGYVELNIEEEPSSHRDSVSYEVFIPRKDIETEYEVKLSEIDSYRLEEPSKFKSPFDDLVLAKDIEEELSEEFEEDDGNKETESEEYSENNRELMYKGSPNKSSGSETRSNGKDPLADW